MNEWRLTVLAHSKADCQHRPTERSQIKFGERPLSTTKLLKQTVRTRQSCGRRSSKASKLDDFALLVA